VSTAARVDAPEVPFWSRAPDELLAQLGSQPQGLAEQEVPERRREYGPNRLESPRGHPTLRLLARQLRSPITLLLLGTAVLSAFLGEGTDAAIILAILLGSTLLGFWQERQAAGVVEELFALIRTTARVRRSGAERDVPVEELVPGDVLVLNAGDLVPADCRVLEEKDLDVDESALTGESFPVPKDSAVAAAEAPLGQRASALFQGTHVISGTGVALVVATGASTIYSSLARDLERRRPESEFERGVRRFGYLLLEVMAVLVLAVFAANVAMERPVLEVFLFSLALAVGLTPQLLPAIVSVTLAQGARRMARAGVVVRRLVSIEDFGGMEILCTDKTGTLTEGRVRVHAAFDAQGRPSERTRRLAWLNGTLQAGFENPIDAALRAERGLELGGVTKLDEVPYDFSRRRLSVLVRQPDGSALLITKGAVPEVLEVCTGVESAAVEAGSQDWRREVEQQAAALGGDGLRCIAVAVRRLEGATTVHRSDEREMTLVGLLALADPAKAGVREVLAQLVQLGVEVKMISGDSRLVATRVARDVGLPVAEVLTGAEVARLGDLALRRRVGPTTVFAEIDPNQKERIILALRGTGASIGYLGDGINDAAALHAADVGISVDTATDVTRRAADIVLLRKDLGVLAGGVAEGRRAFANTLKYVFVTTSANFGNMVSMAGASLLTAFLPMLPKQILLLNLLSDLPAMAIASDRLDPELVSRPRRWDVRFIRDFMITFGLVSSFFDFLTFGLLIALAVPVAQFRTAWFIESVLTELFVLLVIRTARTFYRSAPSVPLVAATAGVAAITFALPYLPVAGVMGFAPLPPSLVLLLVGLTVLLLIASEVAKRLFFRHHPFVRARRG
jgi:Mg2+-importing ATPase